MRVLSTDIKARYAERYDQVEKRVQLEIELAEHRRFVMLANRRREQWVSPCISLVDRITTLRAALRKVSTVDHEWAWRFWALSRPNNLAVGDWRDARFSGAKKLEAGNANQP